ncbi:dephospho-CoA kinase [Gleimia hominis]|uniref:dephospho-CoA kinase n=1 Tax=Gleimia hominis TaxID=595468 RepID=UPI000C804C43|nr:dephospho-CoA kinase [Gleimia hominis]WIK65008.1 dephospho-CoA kinase [Gleimia hominis]
MLIKLRPLPPAASKWVYRVGITGGIGSGKSTFTSALLSLGEVVADADQIAREIVGPGEPALAQIEHRFGAAVIAPNGQLDRARLAEIVFANPTARADLNAITHPLIHARAQALMANAPGRYAFYDAPVLIESGGVNNVDAVVVITAPLQKRAAWVQHERGVSREEFDARIRAQLSDQERLDHAHIEVRNNATASKLREDAHRLTELLDTHLEIADQTV